MSGRRVEFGSLAQLRPELEQHAQVVRVTRLGSTLVLERGATGTAPSVP